MQAYSHPDPLVRPLESNAELIQATSAEPENVVMERLLAEERCTGANVRNDLQTLGVQPHVFSKDMERFYQTTKSFLYETSAWNRAPEKLRMRDWTGIFLSRRSLNKPLRILNFGDGLGFDSTCRAPCDVLRSLTRVHFICEADFFCQRSENCNREFH